MRVGLRRGLRGAATFLPILVLGCLAALRAATPASGRIAGDLPGFMSESVVQGLDFPTSFAIGPDGRIYIAEKSGMVRVAISGTLQAEPFLDLRDDVNNIYDRGLLAVELHPDFPDPPYVYLLHTYDPPATFTAGGPIMFSGQAWDPQDGDLSASIHWTADLYHANHVHLNIFNDIAASGVFTAPDHDADVWIRLCAQASDSDSLPTRTQCLSIFEDYAYGVYIPVVTRIP